MRSTKKIFENFVSDTDSFGQSAPWEMQNMSRVLVIPTQHDARSPLVSEELYRAVAETSRYGCLIESVAPLPLLSFPSDKDTDECLSALIEYLHRKKLRVIIVEGVVQHGNLGGGQRISFGSSGILVALAIEAAVDLPRPYSWVNSAASSRFQSDSGSIQKFRECDFLKLIMPLSVY
jgi:hypothetical protein